MEQRYGIDPNNVIFEAVEAELVVINLKSGCYYSLNETASGIWTLLIDGYSANQIGEFFARHDSSGAEGVLDAIHRMIREFLREDLIHPMDSPPLPGAAPPATALTSSRAFHPPVMTKHSDIQDMLALDPIHEVTDLGWPHKKEPSE
mgnify:CR=1 FL=1